MQENEFEKQVKSTIEGFRLRPSEPVWPGIREEIRDKKRRRILLLIPVLAIMLGLGYFTWQSFYGTAKTPFSQKDLSQTNNTKNKDIHSKRPEQQGVKEGERDSVFTEKAGDRSLPEPGTRNNTEGDDKTAIKTVAISKTLSQVPAEKIKSGKKNGIAVVTKKQSAGGLRSEEKKVLQPRRQRIQKDNLNGGVQSGQPVYSTAEELQLIVARRSPDRAAVATEANRPLRMTVNLMAGNNLVLKEVPPVKSAQPQMRMGKIRWGVDVSVGGASRIDRPFKFASKDRAVPSASSFFGNPVNTGTTGNIAGGGLLALPPSAVSAGAGFKIGFVIDKPLAKWIDVSTGIQYAYASDRITIGKSIYSSNNLTLQDRNYTANAVAQTAYSGLQGQNYTNKYHFVELPVTLHINIDRKWKVPVIWNIGAAVSRLISSNVLLYDQTWGGLYYKGKNDLAKTQFSLATGFSLRLNGRSGWQWSLGPQISMNTTELFKNTTDKDKHILYGGLNLQLLLPGKKR